MDLWSSLPSEVRDDGGLDGLEPLLSNVDVEDDGQVSDGDGFWQQWTLRVGGDDPLSIDPATGSFTRDEPSDRAPLEFPDPRVAVVLRLHLTGDGGDPDGWVQVLVTTPAGRLRIPELRAARLDAQGQLRPLAGDQPVTFLLPAFRLRFERTADGPVDVELLSTATDPAAAADQIYDFVRMEPPYALVGPGETVGFAFRAAVLDLSGTAGPSGVPPEARTMPDAWQGLWLPEVRLFVSPNGMEGIAVSGGVRDLWIGIGAHAGVTGIFEAEVVNRGQDPDVRMRFLTSTGRWIPVPDTDPATPVEVPVGSRLHVDAGGGLAPFTIRTTVDGSVTTGSVATVDPPATGSITVEVRVTDAASHVTTRTVQVARASGDGPGAAPDGIAATATTTSTTGSRIVVLGQTATAVTLGVTPAGGDLAWSLPGGTETTGTVVVPLASGAPLDVTVTRTTTPAAASTAALDCWFRFDHPRPRAADQREAHLDRFATNPDNTFAAPTAARRSDGTAPHLLTGPGGTWPGAAAYPAGTTWEVEGHASYEALGDPTIDGVDRARYDRELSERRRDVLVRILEDAGFTATGGTAHGHDVARTSPDPEDPRWWRATATPTLPSDATETITARIQRPPPVLPDPDPEPAREPVPACFRKLGARVELVRGTFVRAEVYGEFDVQTSAEQAVAATGSTGTLAPRTNPNDGICAFLVRLRITEDRSGWDVTAEFRAIDADLDGLARMRRGTGAGNHTAIDVLGALTALSPLLAEVTPPSPTAGELVPMAIVGGTAVALGASGVWSTREVILRGGQLVVSDGLVDPDSGEGPRRTQVTVLLDVETSFTFDLVIISVAEDRPITARYKAVGLRAGWDTVDDGSGGLEYVPLPVFDPSQGYSLDIPAGSMVAPGPLGELLRVLGGRVSRDNPAFLEVEVGIGVDLGIVGVESARVRVQLDGDDAGSVELTKLAATLDIPGTLHGKGFISITESGFSGGLDLTIVPIEVRAAATLSVRQDAGVTSVLAGLEVEFPVPIVLGSSGLGIFGLLAGVGINVERLPGSGTNPSLDWVRRQLTPPRGSIVHEAGWTPRAGAYAFAAGMLLGTLEGGFLVHLKGAVLIEVPGPRLLLIMKADVLELPPVLDDHNQQATFLAVLEIDFARGEITLGLVAEYTIQQLLEVRVPVTAFFSTEEPSSFYVDLGRFDDPVTVRILDVFEGTGYLMIHGDGISGHPVPELNTGSTNLAIAVGFHLRATLMGSRSIGLYLEAAGGFDALLAFDPLFVGGVLHVSGELRLFIVSIGASARLAVVVTEEKTFVRGEVCGEVDFFFFSVKGCVSFELNAPAPTPTPAPALLDGVVLVGRTPALIEGSAVGRSVDAKLADAVDVTAGGGGTLPTVPLDAIPVVLFDAPLLDAGADVLGGTPNAHPGGSGNPWVRRGDRWWRYELVDVRLEGPLDGGATPATWWRPADTDDPAHGPALALLSWLPTPTPFARPYSDSLVESVTRRYETVCDEVAPPAPLLWTFVEEAAGPSPAGWLLRGEPWPDPADSTRSAPVEDRLAVDELWRVPDAVADTRSGIVPAEVVADVVECRQDPPDTITDVEDWTSQLPTGFSNGAPVAALEDVALFGEALQASGGSLHDLAATLAGRAWDPDLLPATLADTSCRGAVLRSPLFDRGVPAPGAPDEVVARVQEVWDEHGHTPTELADVVRLSAPGGLLGCTVLLLADDEEVGADRLVLRTVDEEGRAVADRVVQPADRVDAGNPLPPRWTDPAGPWAPDVDAAGQVAARIATKRERRESLYLVHVDAGAGSAVHVGWVRQGDRLEPHRRFHVVAIEGQLRAEVARRDVETEHRERDRQAFETALTQAASDHALLAPGQRYEVVVRWRAESRDDDEQPPADTSLPVGGTIQVERFAFRADGTDEAPDDLRPWLLATAPGEDEVGYLTGEPIRVALATGNVARLFAAYDRELRLRVRAASGNHTTPDLTIPVAPTPGVLEPAPDTLHVPGAWEAAALEVADDLRCVPGVGEDEHTIVIFEYEFEPRTDYLLDVVAVPPGAPLDAAGEVVHRVGFSTGLYATVDELARLVRSGSVDHVGIADVTPLALLDEPTGQQVDERFQEAGLAVPQVPRHPRVQVVWSWSDPPQPVAVVVESNEPMWRSRTMPRVVSGPSDAANPGHEWWAGVPVDWLSLAAPADPAPATELPHAPVQRIVRCPGDTRAVVLLGPGARGTAVRLDLVNDGDDLAGVATTRHAAVDVPLLAAPWEEA